ncbi:MAG: NUDIX domain-containing protein [Trueperaceae bacterium]
MSGPSQPAQRPPQWPLATVGALVEGPSGRVLLVRTRKWRGTWGVPGGKIAYGETMVAALRREFEEETGLTLHDVRPGPLQEAVLSDEFHVPAHFVLLNFFARTHDEVVYLNEEAQDYAWVPPREALSMPLNSFTRVLVEAYLRHQGEASAREDDA